MDRKDASRKVHKTKRLFLLFALPLRSPLSLGVAVPAPLANAELPTLYLYVQNSYTI